MGPAEGKLDIVALGERAITRIAVDLQDTCEAGEVSERLRGLYPSGVASPDAYEGVKGREHSDYIAGPLNCEGASGQKNVLGLGIFGWPASRLQKRSGVMKDN